MLNMSSVPDEGDLTAKAAVLAFANAVASRYIEGNDTYPGGGGHPSDCLLPILAVAQANGASMKQAIAGIVLGYEAHRYLFRAFPMRKHARFDIPADI